MLMNDIERKNVQNSTTSDISGNFQNSDGYQSMELALDQFVTHNERLF